MIQASKQLKRLENGEHTTKNYGWNFSNTVLVRHAGTVQLFSLDYFLIITFHLDE